MTEPFLSQGDAETMALDALEKATDALVVLKALLKTLDEPLTRDQARKCARVVNDGYDHAVATLNALGRVYR